MLFNQTGNFDLNHSYTGGCYKDKCLMLLLPAVIEAYTETLKSGIKEIVLNPQNSIKSNRTYDKAGYIFWQSMVWIKYLDFTPVNSV